MKQIAAVLASIWSLFVDDVLFATLIVAWLALSCLLAPVGVASGWHGVMLIAGLGLILVHGAWRKARSS
jgi:hypothetical protein